MKCYKCNGTGYYDIDNECPVCDGTGEYEPFDADVELDKLYPKMKCPNCGKENGIFVKERRGEKGPLSYLCFECGKDIPMKQPTNEEWFCQLSTEEKAEVIVAKIKESQKAQKQSPLIAGYTDESFWRFWFMGVHK